MWLNFDMNNKETIFWVFSVHIVKQVDNMTRDVILKGEKDISHFILSSEAGFKLGTLWSKNK